MSTSSPSRVCIATLAYYAALGNMPLTSTEVWQWQMDIHASPTQLSLRVIRRCLTELAESKKIFTYNGFYTLAEAPRATRERMWRIASTLEKRNSAIHKAAFLPFIPFVRIVRILGSVAIGNAQSTSDIDLSIGVARKRLWLSRALVTLVAHLLGVRRWGSHTTDRLCFNHYTAESHSFYGSTHPAFSHIERQSMPLWSSMHGGKPRFIYALEALLDVSGLGKALEWALGEAQRSKIRSNALSYPTSLPAPSQNSTHLVFYYPRILVVEAGWKKILSSHLVNF